ncbi:hypothetical protein [Taibaiella koreensis]|uniref:hypothetical protein n=1 Tax=Taibaiella koreensis TaxID=1268548 RepID=UPI000E59A831|nr:hypothetical protein [Taibaiella koreensis]
MLPLRLQQIKQLLEEKQEPLAPSGGNEALAQQALSEEERELLAELAFLDASESIQLTLRDDYNEALYGKPLSRSALAGIILAPTPGQCPACGRKFNVQST